MSFDDSFSNRVAMARNAIGLTQTELAKKVGVVPRQIAAYEGGEARPRDKALKNLAAALGATTEWLAKGIGNGPNVSNVKKTVTTALIPVYSRVQAAVLKKNIDSENSSVSMFIPRPENAGENAFAITIEGESMSSHSSGISFPANSIVTIDPDVEPASGDFVLFALEDDNEATFKQLIIDQGKRYLKGLNPTWPITAAGSGTKIIGTAVHSQLYLDRPFNSSFDNRITRTELTENKPYLEALRYVLAKSHLSPEALEQQLESLLHDKANTCSDTNEDKPLQINYSYKSRIDAIAKINMSVRYKIDDAISEAFKSASERVKLYESMSDEEYAKLHQEWLEGMRKQNPSWGSF